MNVKELKKEGRRFGGWEEVEDKQGGKILTFGSKEGTVKQGLNDDGGWIKGWLKKKG